MTMTIITKGRPPGHRLLPPAGPGVPAEDPAQHDRTAGAVVKRRSHAPRAHQEVGMNQKPKKPAGAHQGRRWRKDHAAASSPASAQSRYWRPPAGAGGQGRRAPHARSRRSTNEGVLIVTPRQFLDLL
jgi:hypothetical protein